MRPSMWRLVASAFRAEAARGLTAPVQAEVGKNVTARHHLFNAAPTTSCRAWASAQPKKAQHGNHDDNDTNDPEDIVHSCPPSLRSGRARPTRHRCPCGSRRAGSSDSGAQRRHRAGHYSPRHSPGALTQISDSGNFTRWWRRSGGSSQTELYGAEPSHGSFAPAAGPGKPGLANGPAYRLISLPITKPMPNATSRLMKGRSSICCSRAATPSRPRRLASFVASSHTSPARSLTRPTAARARRPLVLTSSVAASPKELTSELMSLRSVSRPA
ncbi:MAG: hypothetical protein K0R41_1627 [Geminicoccaceae bacterium]|nr:hypothetical protein [Geminicoccaceae bacterium]